MKRYLILIFLIFSVLFFAQDVLSGQATISWEYPDRMAIKGFNLRIISIDNQYTESYYIESEHNSDTEKSKNRVLTLYGLIPGTYHFWITAIYYDKNIESVPSKLQKIIVSADPDPVDLKITQNDAGLQFSWTSPLNERIAFQQLASCIGINDYSPGYNLGMYLPQLRKTNPGMHYMFQDKIDPIGDPYYSEVWEKPQTYRIFFTDSNDKIIAIAETLLVVKQYCE